MAKHGYHVERVLDVRGTIGLSFPLDLVKVAYFDRRDGLQRMELDPEHGRIEAGYAAAVQQSLWLIGGAAP
jgi:hypothetical protein